MSFSVRVPASSANLGPGFDLLALALGLYLQVDVTPGTGEPRVLEGPDLCGGGDLILDGIRCAAEAAGRPLPGCELTVRADIPVARGLGSSAAALVAGLLIGNRLLGDPLDQTRLFEIATEAEGHGDNVAAALFGGVALVVATKAGPLYRPIPMANELRAVVFVPAQTGFTHEARSVVPETVSRADAVANAGRCALLALAFSQGDDALLGEAMDDRLHQPYRAKLFPYLPTMIAAAREAGAHGASLSGAGPSILALCAPERTSAVQAAFESVAPEAKVPGRVLDLAIATAGAEFL